MREPKLGYGAGLAGGGTSGGAQVKTAEIDLAPPPRSTGPAPHINIFQKSAPLTNSEVSVGPEAYYACLSCFSTFLCFSAFSRPSKGLRGHSFVAGRSLNWAPEGSLAKKNSDRFSLDFGRNRPRPPQIDRARPAHQHAPKISPADQF